MFSVGHPFADYLLHPAGNYFETELVEFQWTGFGMPITMPSYRRRLGAVLDPLLPGGCLGTPP